MANGTRSSSRKAKDDENNNLKGSQNSGKKSANSGAATEAASGVRRSPRETLSKKNMTPPSSSGTRKSERLEKQTLNLNSMTPAKRKTERVEKKKKNKNASPLRRSERGKMSSSASSGSKRSDKSLDVLNTKRKKEKKDKCVKQLTMQTVEINKIEQEDVQAKKTQKKRMDARSYKALFTKQPQKVDGTDHCDDLNGTDSGRKEDILEEFTEITHERTTVTSTSQFAEEELKRNNEHKLFHTSQKNCCKDMSSNGDDLQISQNGLLAGETNDDAETATLRNLQSPQLVPGGVFDCDISVEMVPKVMPSERKDHDIDIEYVASPKISSCDVGTCTEAGTSLSSGCKRKDCTETRGMCSKRQRVDCNSTKQGICSSNMKLSKFFGSSDAMDRGELDAGISTGHIEKPCNHIQQHMPSADLQTGCDQNTCIICRLDGKLLCCHGKGCQRSYHLSCLEPPLEEFPLGAWYCLECARKKLESGIYSVSEGIEAIWDSSELEDPEDGLQRQKQYFVKYKGLAHVHNRWVPESQVLLEAPSLIAKHNGKKQGTVWKQQWAVPRRLLQKRLLTTPKECGEDRNEEHDVDKLKCHVEWLVKWCGLGYEHASWELENSSFFSCPEGQRLIREYETRKKAQRASKFDKEHLRERAVASPKISHLPAAVSSGLDANLDAVSKLCNYWRRGENAIIFDDRERISNVISSIIAFSSEISRPFLIISSSASQYSWDEKFLHLAPSVDVVVYNGSKEIRNSISNLEFYDEGSCIMFQVLITSPEVISEDLNVLDCIGWEAIIVDECQSPRIGSCFEQFKMLTASKRLLIISSQLKDNVAEYLNLLSLLDSQSDSNDTELTNSSDNIDTLKERLKKYVAYECKLESSRFLEYWVPVLLSNVQLEKYCFTLVSNSLSLRSPSKTDPVGVLRSILVSSRKCCDHPYDVDQSLQPLLTKGLQEVEFLEIGIKASGKLQLLDAMLSEIKKRELKVLILFQYIGGSGRDLIGDILDDFLRQRFGIDSYEHVDNGVAPSKKQSALKRFNNERERFIFLLETRACLPSIKLSEVGTVIIFGSDWSPSNDLRALQRINIDSQFEQIKVFRLYSSFTVEEKLLMLSKQDKAIDSNVENISPGTSHMLLKWGASSLFSQLETFHDISTPDASTLSQKSHLKDVIREFTILLQTGIDDTSKLSLVLQAKQNQGTYRTEMPLFGEQKNQVMNEEDSAHTFWTKLLEGKCPRWKYSTNTFQRNRKRVQYFDELQKIPQAEIAEVAKRRKKFVSDGNGHPSPKTVLKEGKLAAGGREGRSGTSASASDKIHATSSSLHEANNISKTPDLKMVEWESRRKQRDSQKNLHVLLRPQIAKLCEILHLTEDVKAMVERFLEYVMDNHLVHREPATILQAFQISLCWSAAALLKQKLDHKESLALAKQHLGFTCKKEEADYVYSLLRCLKRMFLYRTGYLKVPNSPKVSGLSSKAVERDYSNATPYQQNIKAKVEHLSGFQEGSDIQTFSESGVAPEIQLAQRDLIKSIKEIQKKCDKLMKKQTEKHKQEMEQFNQKYEEEKAQLENKKRTEEAVIRLHSNVSMRTDKLKSLDTEYARKFDELERQKDIRLKELEALQVASRTKIQERKTRWVESVESWARVELVKSPVSETNLSKGRSSGIFQSASGSEVRPSKIIHIVDDEAMAYSNPINKAGPLKENTEGASVECNLTANSGCVEEQAVSRDSCLREQDSVDEIPKGGVLEVLSMRCSDEQISEGSKAITSDRETVSLTDVLENLVSMEAPSLLAPSSEKISDKSTLRKVDGETLRESVTIISSEGRENFVSLEASSYVAIHDESDLSKVDGPVPLKESVVANSGEGQEKLVSAEARSSEKNLNGAALNNFDSSGEGYESSPSFLVPSSEEVPSGTTLNTVNSELPLSRPEAICSTEAQGNIMSANCSLEKQIPGEATLNMPDEEIQKSISEIATSCDGTNIIVCTKSSASKEQIPDTTACSMPAKEVPLAEPETAPSEVLKGGNLQKENGGTSPNENDQRDGVVCTVNRESELQEPLSDLVSTDVDSLPCASSEVQARCLANSEMQNASQAAEISPFNGATIDETCNESNPDVTVVELTEQVQQLRSSESTSNLSPPDLPSVSAVEHPSNNESQTSNQSSQAPSQPVANHIDGVIDGLMRQASETRIGPIPFASSGLPLQTAPAVSSRMPDDPLKIEIERIKKEKEQTTKIHEDSKLQLKLECDKEIEEAVAQIRRKYEVKLKEKEAEYLLQNKELDVYSNKVLLNKKLAEAFRSKCMDNRASGSTGAMQEANSSFLQQQQLFQLSSQQMVQQPSTTSGLPSTGSALSMPIVSTAALNSQIMSPSLQSSTALGIPLNGSASTMQTVSPAVVNAQTMGPPLQVVNPSALFSGTPTRPPHISTISSSTGNLQISIEVRAPAPHLQPFRPSSTISPSSLPLHSGVSSQQAHNNHPATFMSLRQSYVNPLAHRQASTTGQSGRTQPEIARVSTAPPNSRLPSLDVLMGVNDPSGANANPPGFLLPNSSSRSAARLPMESRVPSSQSNSAQQSGGATGIVCLSDDD